MRIVVISVAVIIALGFLYTGFNFLFVSPPASKTRTPVVASNSDKVSPSSSSIEEKKMSVRTVRSDIRAKTEIKSAVANYEVFEEHAPRQASSTIKLLINSMKKGRLPSVFLSAPNKTDGGRRRYERLFMDAERVINSSEMGNDVVQVDCKDVQDMGYAYAHILVGDILDNVFICKVPPEDVSENQLFLGGPGNDKITDLQGNKIINGGTGNDQIFAGRGRKILVFEKGWGNDEVKADCRDSIITKNSIPDKNPLNRYWTFKFSNFVVFGPQVREQDMEWDGLTYRNKVTGDSVTFNNKCYNFVFYDK